MEHSFNGPSSLFRRMLCPGSYHAERGMPEVPSHDAQEDGARWHDQVAEILNGNNRFEPADEVIDALTVFQQFRREFEDKATVLVEEKITFKAIPECEVGTPDCVIFQPFDKATIIDWKFTHINPEPAAGNLQLLAYAIEIAEQYELREVKVVLACVLTEKISSHTYNWFDLQNGKARIQNILANAMLEDAPRVVGLKQCRYCRAATSCLSLATPDGAMAVPEGIHPESLGALAVQSSIVTMLTKRINEEVLARLKAGEFIPGWKLGETRATRRWMDNEDEPVTIAKLVERLGVSHEEFCELKLPSVAVIEKKFGKDTIKDMWISTHGVKAVRTGDEDE